jgi:hypothetical protein
LREQDAATRALFVFDDDLAVVEIRRHAGVLKSAGFFGKISGEFRVIKKTWTARFKGTQLPAYDRLADMLVELANHVEARKSLEKDARLRAICAHRFFGLDTNIDCLLAANRLAAHIRSAFTGQAEPERSIRRLLLEGEIDTLDDIRMLATDARLGSIEVNRCAYQQSRRIPRQVGQRTRKSRRSGRRHLQRFDRLPSASNGYTKSGRQPPGYLEHTSGA